ncbi:MAG: (d)CMP kinase [Deltaproteobacteria bacterium]|nr:(d)CMP kinase [Deltaproteobacteria bacterium]
MTKSPPSLIVAIDGPSGVGKSTVARRLAKQLEVPYLDTGAMYRAVGLKALQERLDPADQISLEPMLEGLDVRLQRASDGAFHVLLDGEDVEQHIRTEKVGAAASAVATHRQVRQQMVTLQRRCAEQLGGVLEGRDIGTQVFPDTPYKFFLDAKPEVRYRRRYLQLQEQGRDISYDQVVEEVSERDRRDRGREDSPLTFDQTYTLVDATDLTVDEVVAEMVLQIRQR